MRNRNLPIIERLEITDAGAEGMAVGRFQDMVIFVPWAVPGDIVDVRVVRKRKRFWEARLIRIIKESENRRKPWCSHFGICGGCRWQNMDYSTQLFYKAKWVNDTLLRLGKFEFPEPLPILGSPGKVSYRNKMEFTFSNRRFLDEGENADDPEITLQALGLHLPDRFDRVLDIQHCYLQPESSNKIRLAVKRFALEHGLVFQDLVTHHGFLRNLIIRNNQEGDYMVIMVFGEYQPEPIHLLMDFLKETFTEIKSLYYLINTKANDSFSELEPILYAGQEVIIEEMDDLKFRISPLSFFQTNILQTKCLYKVAMDFVELKAHEIVYDLYTGTGTIACFVAKHCQKVIGIEYVERAIEDARMNARMNSIENVEFLSGDVLQIMNQDFIAKYGFPDVIITDPPRSGMHPQVVKRMLDILPSRIVYISCNPATQARDVSLLSEKYHVRKVQPIDMFPHTSHVENVMLLERKDQN
ncbi:MAG TPA: 23S rRNA (uracil(1939)-C(5))-methyltransferase RlmD [Bacteroidales bacterium]|jgi:23S rRNA (uracil1939-C5)-methyltransferase|nr:23S rRNA (uracil(1939)-C(5))-methyltransferase RlmD [Bacteroidota bacterium]OQC60800.1 MAG: 23S rRNA (uracil-C(5))-methyltransferase RlmCD [Bacteroidetes bacterium ADurb.Bin012]HNQ59628.1 23S rRNA (uracil(1939)-C(5))-methyltransferase RlmD [Bacteroidales bacterium]HNU21380.1 23S rRNA (uracil(1939)-C(5))-methyltransferase RlmD [Bacteroidales bacterium]HNV16776.1 23S rRNA (uracil(1939)-C(5))-methyltransferase RlmD [Bacteroidales bacterium]